MSTASHAPEFLSAEMIKTIDERAHWCFGCGPGNPQGLHLSFTFARDTPRGVTATSIVNLTRFHEGPPGHIHGGIIAVLMDEAMSKINAPLNVLAMTRHMEVDYLRPCPLGVPLTLVSFNLRREGRKLFHQAELSLPDGTLLARGKGVFLVIDPSLLAAMQADPQPTQPPATD